MLIFGFGLWFSTTAAEPALIAVTQEAAEVAAQVDIIAPGEKAKASYALGLCLTTAETLGCEFQTPEISRGASSELDHG